MGIVSQDTILFNDTVAHNISYGLPNAKIGEIKDAAKTGPAKGMVNRLDEMLPAYYEARGWTVEGEPTPATLKRLNV